MEQILSKLAEIESKVHSLRKACKQNNIGISFLNGFNIKKMRDIYNRLQKHYEQNPEKGKALWFQSELKLFNWVLISYSLISNQKIENFNQQDWGFFKRIFFGKDIYTFKYESKKLLNRDSKNQRTWNPEEDQILTTIMQDPSMKNRWSQVARMFYEMSIQRYFRTGKQCREHWLNHLDQTKKHGKWNVQEDLIILKYVILNGKKWSTISKEQLSHRTEHMIKNRFKSLLVRFQKNSEISEDNENLCIKILINKLKNKNHDQVSSQKQIKDQEIENSEQIQSNLLHSAQVNIQKDDRIHLNHIVSENNKPLIPSTNTQIVPQQLSCSNILLNSTPNASPMYSTSPTVFSLYYQPSFFCVLIASYWNFCTGYIERQSTQSE